MSYPTRIPEAPDLLTALIEDLQVDHVLSAGQLRRRYGLVLDGRGARDLGLCWTERTVTTVHNSPSSVLHLGFVVLPDLHRAEGWRLGHAAGTAEVRSLLGVERESWRSTAAEVGFHTATPDAVFASSAGLAAVEFDTGSYGREVVQTKLRAHCAFPGGAVWATSGERRSRAIRDRSLVHHRGRIQVVRAAWWI